MHLEIQFTENVENGAQRLLPQDSLQVVTQDSGQEVRNLRAASEPRTWQIALPTIDIDEDTADFDSVMTLWGNSSKGSWRGLYSFNFHCFVDDATYHVRFASSVQVTAPAGHLRHIDTFTIREVIETMPETTVPPSISGTTTVGSTLTAAHGTWSDSPTSYAYQWTRDGADISTATGSTYVLVSGDSGHLIGCYVTATDANGYSGRAWAAEVDVP